MGGGGGRVSGSRKISDPYSRNCFGGELLLANEEKTCLRNRWREVNLSHFEKIAI